MRLCVCQPVLVPCSSLLLLSYFRPSTSSCVTYLSFAKYWNTLAFLSSRTEFRPPFCGGRNAVEGPAVSPAEQQVSRLRRHPAALQMTKQGECHNIVQSSLVQAACVCPNCLLAKVGVTSCRIFYENRPLPNSGSNGVG